MRPHSAVALVAVLLLALWAWRSQLFTVSDPGDGPLPLRALPDGERTQVDLDVILPAVPAGMEHLRAGGTPLLVHYWAPWERNGVAQARTLDSLARLEELERLRVVLVCFDPFPSVARFVGRHRLRLSVLLDTERRLHRTLPCPSVPFTYALDPAGRLAIAQAGEVDWWSDRTRETLRALIEETGVRIPRVEGPREWGTRSIASAARLSPRSFFFRRR